MGLKQHAATLQGKGRQMSGIIRISGIPQCPGPHSTITGAHSVPDTMHSFITGHRRNTGDVAIAVI